MRCKKCGAGLTWLAGSKTWQCEFCEIEYQPEQAKSITLDQFITRQDNDKAGQDRTKAE